VARSLFQLPVPARRTLNPALRHREGMITLLLPGRWCTPSREIFWTIFTSPDGQFSTGGDSQQPQQVCVRRFELGWLA
jgi:hypothetical protein